MTFTIYGPGSAIREVKNELEVVAWIIHELVGMLPHEDLGRLTEELDKWASMDAPCMAPGDSARFLGGKISVVHD